MKCSNWQIDNPEGVKFCGECGRPLLIETTCLQCGRKNPLGKKIYHNCSRSFIAKNIQTVDLPLSLLSQTEAKIHLKVNSSEIEKETIQSEPQQSSKDSLILKFSINKQL